MFAATKTFVMTEWKRLVRYTIGGATLGVGTGYGGGKYVMDSLLLETEESVNALINENVWKPAQPATRFIIDRALAKAKREGAEQLAFTAGWYGLLTGVSLGMTRISLGLGFKALGFVGRKLLRRK